MNRGESGRNPPAGAPRVAAGSISVLRLYDIAYAIDLAAVDELVRSQQGAPAARLRLRRAEPKAMAFGEPPLEVGLGPLLLDIGGCHRSFEAIGRIHEFGVVTIVLRLPASDLDWHDYAALVGALDVALGAEAAAGVWTEQLQRVRGLIAPAIERPSPAGLEEDYLIATVNRFDQGVTGAEALEQLDLPALLSGDARALSPTARAELLRQAFTYYEDDLAVITWDHAFILEPGGDTDVADVLEVANAQLLECRYYDAVLDDELPRMYERVRETHRTFRALATAARASRPPAVHARRRSHGADGTRG